MKRNIFEILMSYLEKELKTINDLDIPVYSSIDCCEVMHALAGYLTQLCVFK